MKGRAWLLSACAVLCLAGCEKAPAETAPTAAPAVVITPAPGSLGPAAGQDVLAAGHGDGTKAQVRCDTAEESVSWQVESWAIYPSWAAAGVDTEELIASDAELEDVLLAEDGGGMLIARMRYTNETIYTEGGVWRYANELRPAVDGEAAGSPVVWFPERGQDVIDGGPWGTAFYIPPKGDSALLTLGWVLTPEAVAAAPSGTLSLLCDDGADPAGDILLPLVTD